MDYHSADYGKLAERKKNAKPPVLDSNSCIKTHRGLKPMFLPTQPLRQIQQLSQTQVLGRITQTASKGPQQHTRGYLRRALSSDLSLGLSLALLCFLSLLLAQAAHEGYAKGRLMALQVRLQFTALP